MKITGDHKGVLAFKKMYMNDKETALSYLKILKKRKLVYFREANTNNYILFSMNAESEDILKITIFQEGQIKSVN